MKTKDDFSYEKIENENIKLNDKSDSENVETEANPQAVNLSTDIFKTTKVKINPIKAYDLSTQTLLNTIADAETFGTFHSNNILMETTITDGFNSDKFDDYIQKNVYNKFDLMIKVPTRPILIRNTQFDIFIAKNKTSKMITSNVIIKFVSNDYYFSDSMISLSEEKKKIKLTKKRSKTDFVIKLKIYVNNSLNKVLNYNLWSREQWV